MKIFLVSILFVFASFWPGMGQYTIVQPQDATEAEKFAAQQFSDFIGKSAGKALPIVTESEFKGGKAIYVGQSEFARKAVTDFKKLKEEEWLVRAVDGNLIITGGRPRGTLYGVYEYLEKEMGVRFLDADTEVVPRKAFSIPDKLEMQGSPAFHLREVYRVVNGYGPSDQGKQELFQVRKRMNGFLNAQGEGKAKYGFAFQMGSPASTHTHKAYMRDFPGAFNKPEYGAMNRKGARMSPEVEVCMSNPEVRKIFAEKLREYIRRDRAEIDASHSGKPYPYIYALTPNDGSEGQCFCETCMALKEKYGSYSGVVLEFVNAVADDIAKDHPEILVRGDAYYYYMDPPKGIKPHANVVFYLAQLGSEFNSKPLRDTLRSMNHPVNAEAKKQWQDWSAISGMMGVHDYWTPWSQPYQWPYVNVRGEAETLKFYYDHGVRYFFTEDPLFGTRIYNFVDLQFYVAAEVLENPTSKTEPIIEEFMRLYYGPSAPAMRRLLDYMERRQEEEPGCLASVQPTSRKYYDTAYFIETNVILDEAEKSAAGDSQRVANIRQERLPLDETMLYLWPKLEKTPQWPFDRKVVLERLKQNYAFVNQKYGGWGTMEKSATPARLAYLKNMPAVPEQFQGKEIIDLVGPMLELRPFARKSSDKDAACQSTWKLDATMKKVAGEHTKPMEFGLSDAESSPKFLKRTELMRDDIPKDEKYHWYLVGSMKASPDMTFWAHHSWGATLRLMAAYNSALPDQYTYDVYVSMKFEGPDYVDGSTKVDAVSIDRLILVKTDTEK